MLVYLAAALAVAVIANASPSTVKQIIRIGLSAIPALLALFPVATLFDRMNWPVFDSWGLAHGSFLVAVPVMACPIYVVLGSVPWLRDADDSNAA